MRADDVARMLMGLMAVWREWGVRDELWPWPWWEDTVMVVI